MWNVCEVICGDLGVVCGGLRYFSGSASEVMFIKKTQKLFTGSMNARSMFCGWPNAEKSFCVVQVKYPYCCDMITVDLFLQKMGEQCILLSTSWRKD